MCDTDLDLDRDLDLAFAEAGQEPREPEEPAIDGRYAGVAWGLAGTGVAATQAS